MESLEQKLVTSKFPKFWTFATCKSVLKCNKLGVQIVLGLNCVGTISHTKNSFVTTIFDKDTCLSFRPL